MKKFLLAMTVIAALALAGCGQRVEVPAAHTGKLMTKNGYQEQIIPTSTLRINRGRFCMFMYCDKLVLLDVSDFSVNEDFTLYMPEDKLEMGFRLGATMTVNPDKLEELFNRIPVTKKDGKTLIEIRRAYEIYAQRIIRAETRAFLTQYSILEISSNRDIIGARLAEKLSEIIESQTPFRLRYAGLDDVDYPSIIIEAQKKAAERREDIQRSEAQLEVSRVEFQRQFEEQQLQRRVDVERAEAEAEVNRILADSVTPQYELYRKLQIMDRIADSDNKTFVPVEMLSSMAGQVMLGNEGSRR